MLHYLKPNEESIFYLRKIMAYDGDTVSELSIISESTQHVNMVNLIIHNYFVEWSV